MATTDHDLDAARAAKDKLRVLLPKTARVAGVGIAEREGRYVVKVNLESESDVALPEEVDGVPVVFQVVGQIRKQD